MLSSAPVAQPTSSPRAPRVEFRRRAPVGGGVQAIGAMAVRRALTRVAAVRAPQHLASRFAPAPSTSTRLATLVRTAFACPGRAFEPRRAFSAAAAARVAALGASADAPEPEAVPFASLEDAHPAVLASLSRRGPLGKMRKGRRSKLQAFAWAYNLLVLGASAVFGAFSWLVILDGAPEGFALAVWESYFVGLAISFLAVDALVATIVACLPYRSSKTNKPTGWVLAALVRVVVGD